MNAAVALDGVTKSFGTFALRDVSFTLPEGYIMGFVGPNGAGKTTTIRCMLALAGVDSGSVEVLGERVDPAGVAGRGVGRREEVGIVLDRPCYVGEWRVGQVERAVRPFYRAWDDATFDALLNRFGLRRETKVKELSRGMAMKLQVAVALSHHARLLILDEPTSGLDPVARDELLTLLAEHVQDERNSVFFSTHITTDLERSADYLTLIRDGRITATGPTEDILGGYRMVKGGPDDLDDDAEQVLLGLRRHRTGFDALARTADVALLPDGLVVERASLDDIIIRTATGTNDGAPARDPGDGTVDTSAGSPVGDTADVSTRETTSTSTSGEVPA